MNAHLSAIVHCQWRYRTDCSKAALLLKIICVFFCFMCFSCFSTVYCCLVVTCWESADLLTILGDVYCIFVTFPYGMLGQVWYLVVSFPDLYRLAYFAVWQNYQSGL